MRAYFLTNMYLSSIQHGIQAAHCLQEINTKYKGGTDQALTLFDWAEDHKTMYVLNGGTSEQMHEILNFFRHESNNLPWHYFHEPSLDNALTCIGIIVPEEIYNRPDKGWYDLTFEGELSQLLRSKRFAT